MCQKNENEDSLRSAGFVPYDEMYRWRLRSLVLLACFLLVAIGGLFR